MSNDKWQQIFSNLIIKSTTQELDPYELVLYHQICTTIKQEARLYELILYKSIKETKDVIWPDKDEGRTSSQDFDTEERGNSDQSPEI